MLGLRLMVKRGWMHTIDPRYLEDSLMELHFAVNDMDNAIYEIDIYEPGLFMRIARKLGEVINDNK